MPGGRAGTPQRARAAAGRRAHRQPPRPRSGALRPEPARPDTNLAPCPSPPPPRSSWRAWGATTASGRRCSDVSLTLHTGATLAVLGSNGAGKTTLLRLLATLLRPHAGRARVLGRELPRDGWAVRGSIGFLGHEPLLYRDLIGAREPRPPRSAAPSAPRACARTARQPRAWPAAPPSRSEPSPAAWSSASPSAAPSCTDRRCCCWTSRSPTWTPPRRRWSIR